MFMKDFFYLLLFTPLSPLLWLNPVVTCSSLGVQLEKFESYWCRMTHVYTKDYLSTYSIRYSGFPFEQLESESRHVRILGKKTKGREREREAKVEVVSGC